MTGESTSKVINSVIYCVVANKGDKDGKADEWEEEECPRTKGGDICGTRVKRMSDTGLRPQTTGHSWLSKFEVGPLQLQVVGERCLVRCGTLQDPRI